MNATKMLEVLDEFVQESNKEKCITFDGSWGIGKTYSINHWCDNFKQENTKVIYISLFGVHNSNELITKLINKLSKIKGLMKKICKTMSGVSLGIQGFSFSIPSLFELNKLPKIKNGKYVFVFDDLERKGNDFDFRSLFSIIEQLNNNDNVKVVTIINSYKLSDDIEYENYKEKVCDKTYKVDKPDFNIINKLVNDGLEFDLYSEIQDVIIKYNLKNLRTFKKINRFISKISVNLELFKDDEVRKSICQWTCLIISQIEDNIFLSVDFEKEIDEAGEYLKEIVNNRKLKYNKITDQNFKNLLDNVGSNNNLEIGTFEWELVENIYNEYLHCNSKLEQIEIISSNKIKIDRKLKDLFYYDSLEKIRILEECINEVNDNWECVNEKNILSCFDLIINYYTLILEYKMPVNLAIDDYINKLITCVSDLFINQKCPVDRLDMKLRFDFNNLDIKGKIKDIIIESEAIAFKKLMLELNDAFQKSDIVLMNILKDKIFTIINSRFEKSNEYEEKLIDLINDNNGLIINPSGQIDDKIWRAINSFYKEVAHSLNILDYYDKLFETLIINEKDPTTSYRLKCLRQNINRR